MPFLTFSGKKQILIKKKKENFFLGCNFYKFNFKEKYKKKNPLTF